MPVVFDILHQVKVRKKNRLCQISNFSIKMSLKILGTRFRYNFRVTFLFGEPVFRIKNIQNIFFFRIKNFHEIYSILYINF